MLLVGPTGIGKSSFSFQAKILWALGRPCCGLEPTRPLKSILFQAENDDDDLIDMRDGVVKGLKLTPQEADSAFDNIRIVTCVDASGKDFYQEVMDPHLGVWPADLAWVDPSLAYVGGDAKSQEHVGAFLRNGINPIIHKRNCACVMVHHPNKPQPGNMAIPAEDLAYYGSGSIEWANCARSTLALRRHPKHKGVFELIANKRWTRLKWLGIDGNPVDTRYLRQSTNPDMLFWEETTLPASDSHALKNGASTEAQIVALVPETGTIEKTELIYQATQNKIGRDRATDTIKSLLINKRLFESEIPRTKAPPCKLISRTKSSRP